MISTGAVAIRSFMKTCLLHRMIYFLMEVDLRGGFTNEIVIRYGCRSIIFEPVHNFADKLKLRYANNDRIEVIEAALSNRNDVGKIVFAMDGSSIFNARFTNLSQNEMFEIKLICIKDFLLTRQINNVGLLKLNIEGSEYEVLEQLLDSNLLKSIRCLLVQFHRVDAQSEQRRSFIRDGLQKSHSCIFDFPFVWECWVRTQ